MSAPAPTMTRPRAPSASSTLAGTGTLVRFLLRRDRVKLPAWAGGLGLFVVYLTSAVPAIAETEEELRGAVALFNDPIGRMLIGPGYGFGEPTIERFIANGYGLYFLLFAALMSILLMVRHTRVEEQSGRAELVRANVVGARAPLAAAMVVAVITNLTAAATVFSAMIGVGGFEVHGSLLFAAGLAAVGLAFAGLTTITVQLSEYSRATAGMAGAALGLSFVLRAGGDMVREGGNALSWLSPLAWSQQTAPFVLDRWWPLLFSAGFAVVTAAVGYALSTRRDLGASQFAVRPGPARARASLGTPLGLALRLQRAGILGWGVSLAVAGLVFGAYAEALLGGIEAMPEAFLELFGADDLLAGYLAYMATYMAFLAGAFIVMSVQGLRTEENRGRLEPVLATPVSRRVWLVTNVAVIAAAALVIMLVTGVATGTGAAIVTGDASHVMDLVLAHLNQVPAVLVVLGVAVLLFGVFPRGVPATWGLVAYGMIIGTFGRMLELPSLVSGISPFTHPAQMPLEPFAAAPLVLLFLVSAVAFGSGLTAFRRRGINVG